jgi:hypothetical protein
MNAAGITTEPRTFHLGDVLTITTGRLVAPRHMAAVYDLLDFMTGDSLFTHQLPRAAGECGPALLTQHPHLREVAVPEEFTDESHVDQWLAEQVGLFGAELPVRPLSLGDHTRINPMEELAVLAPGVEIIPVMVGAIEQ